LMAFETVLTDKPSLAANSWMFIWQTWPAVWTSLPGLPGTGSCARQAVETNRFRYTPVILRT
jgi:hypothetical protein